MNQYGVLLCESKAFVHEPTVANRIDRVAVDELLLAQRRPVARGMNQAASRETRGRRRHHEAHVPGSSLASLLPSWSSPQKVRRRTHEFPSASGVVGGDEPSIFERNPWSKNANLKPHCRWFHIGVAAPMVQSSVSTSGWPTYL